MTPEQWADKIMDHPDFPSVQDDPVVHAVIAAGIRDAMKARLDEIERLRAENDELERDLDRMTVMRDTAQADLAAADAENGRLWAEGGMDDETEDSMGDTNERLRDAARADDDGITRVPTGLLLEAAVEIERLRRENERLQASLD